MFSEEKRAYGICKRENYPEEKTRAICQVFNTDTKRAARERKVMQEEGITLVYFSGMPGAAEQSSYECFYSNEPDPLEALLLKEQIQTMLNLINKLPERYRRFVMAALENGHVGIFEEDRQDTYGEVEAMATLLSISTKTVRRYADAIKERLFRAGKNII